MESSGLRQSINESLAAGRWVRAQSQLRALWEREAGPAVAGYVVASFEKLRAHIELVPHRLAILRSFTVEPAVPLLRAAGFAAGVDLTVHLGDFNAYAQELLDPGSAPYAFEPDTVILTVLTRDLAPELWGGQAANGVAQRIGGQFDGWVEAFRGRTHANLVIHTLEAPHATALGVYDSQRETNQAETVYEINRQLRRQAARHKGVYILDYDSLVARHGRETWGDERKWLTVRLPITAANLIHVTREWMRFLAPLTGRIAKAVAVDLDNTLWGGVIGEDGLAGIQVGPEYPAAGYLEFQRALLDLTRRGILLAICSKNNPQDAMEALTQHPGMLLRPEHFAAARINWNDKGQSLRELARELTIGLDAIALLDDNPVERQQVREQAPEVMVVELPENPMGYARAVRDYPAFERLALSDEDRQRTTYYAAERERSALEQGASSREEFYRSLAQTAEIAPVQAFTLARVAQLTQKTNQFNLTTRRYTEQQVEDLAARPGWQVLSLKVSDRYADNGLVGVAITSDRGEVCEIDTFLLSCRVIGRTVETALLAYLAEEARARGARRLEGWFLPTRKNAPAKDFYRDHGFEMASETANGQLWTLELMRTELRCPDWVQLVIPVTEKA